MIGILQSKMQTNLAGSPVTPVLLETCGFAKDKKHQQYLQISDCINNGTAGHPKRMPGVVSSTLCLAI